MGMGDWQSALTILTTLITASPQNAIAINNMCICMLYLGKLQEVCLRLYTIFLNIDVLANTDLLNQTYHGTLMLRLFPCSSRSYIQARNVKNQEFVIIFCSIWERFMNW
jgi:hypothetical protein